MAHSRVDLPKIGLGLTLLQQVDSFVFMRWAELLRSHYWPGPVLNGRRAYVVMARNIVIDDFFQRDQYPLPADDWKPGELEALLFWDSDNLPPMVIPQRDGSEKVFTRHLQDLLIDNPEKELIGGLYFSREPNFERTTDGRIVKYPHEPVAYDRLPDPRWGHGYKYISFERMRNEILTLEGRYKLHKIGGVGTGAMLIRKSLLQRLAVAKDFRPLFEAPPTDDGRQWTEDLHFCEQVQNLDPPAEIWLDAAGESAHQGDRIWLRSQHYLAGHGEIGLTAQAAINRDAQAVVGPPPAKPPSRIILPN